MTGVVDWDDGNQHQITDQFIWQHTPSVLEVRLSLENLWVYYALLSIIHDTNEKANYENAPIRKISSLEIGKQAVGSCRRFRRRRGGGGWCLHGVSWLDPTSQSRDVGTRVCGAKGE